MSRGAILWDFDGTLASRVRSAHGVGGALWAPCLIEVLDAEEPGHSVAADHIRPHLRDGFPWHRHQEPHPELSDGDAWWGSVEPVFGRAFEGVGIGAERARMLSSMVRARYIDGSHWSLYEDSRPTLERLREDGWQHVIVSNHVPELDEIVSALGIGALVDGIVCSAVTGYEKPHPEAFAIARRMVGCPERVWMVGDNPESDILGAEAVGIPAIQVRSKRGSGARLYAEDLNGILDIIR